MPKNLPRATDTHSLSTMCCLRGRGCPFLCKIWVRIKPCVQKAWSTLAVDEFSDWPSYSLDRVFFPETRGSALCIFLMVKGRLELSNDFEIRRKNHNHCNPTQHNARQSDPTQLQYMQGEAGSRAVGVYMCFVFWNSTPFAHLHMIELVCWHACCCLLCDYWDPVRNLDCTDNV